MSVNIKFYSLKLKGNFWETENKNLGENKITISNSTSTSLLCKYFA
jgi:hypothetical protein